MLNQDFKNAMDRLNELGLCTNWVRVNGNNAINREIVEGIKGYKNGVLVNVKGWDNGISPCGKFKAVVIETGILGLVHNI